jgi:acetyl esterase/lipase
MLSLLFITGCWTVNVPEQEKGSLRDARAGFRTTLVPRVRSARNPVPDPPPDQFRKVYYESPAGNLAAYISQVPEDGKKRPAIVWITGGDCNSIDAVWESMPPENDQTASAYRRAGIVMMFPSLRGGNDNPGTKEGFLGEVDDVLAAALYLAHQDFVEPNRIYLGGHSTGGTLVLLVAECSDRFRAVFSFGPVHDVSVYDSEYFPFELSDPRELKLRCPGHWLGSIQSPTFILEGMDQPGNLIALNAMSRATSNPMVHFLPVPGSNHFSVLAPANALIAGKILRDVGPSCNIAVSDQELGR